MRHAVYFAPAAGSLLEQRAAAWLGRDLLGRTVARPAVPGFTADRLEALTAPPRHYGFHATLKPPFALAEGTTVDDLTAAMADFASPRASFSAPRPRVEALGDFLALRTDSVALDDLAADCVRAFDFFRGPQSEAEIARRRSAGLSRRQEDMLNRWGYPYVMDQFRFHMTLTGPIADAAERDALAAWLEDWLAPALTGPLAVREIALYSQADRAVPFTLTRRFPFAAGKRP